MDRVPGLRKGLAGVAKVGVGDQEVVGVVGGQGEDADASKGKGMDQRIKNASLGETQRAAHCETAKAALGLDRRRNCRLVTDNGQLVGCSSE